MNDIQFILNITLTQGRQRMFGSISFGVASSLVGFIADWTNDMNAIFYVYAMSAVCFIIVAGSTQFKPERIEQNSRLTRPFLQHHPQPKTNTSATSRSTGLVSGTGHRASEDDWGQRSRMKQFQMDFNDDFMEEDIEEESQIRQNEIQRLIQFATESSIIEAVNLSNPPAYRRRASTADINETVSSQRQPSNVLELLKQPQVLLFFTTMMLMGASLNMVISFLFIFLKQDLGASSSVVGLTGLVGSVTELLFFFYSRDVSSDV